VTVGGGALGGVADAVGVAVTVGYHDTREPCTLCALEREPGEEG